MPELTFRSAGVSSREIDTSGPRGSTPVGVPAGIIGTANDGPAFVPVTIGSFADFVATFGGSDGEKFGPLAVNEWLQNAGSCTYLRVLGCGDGKKRDSNTGRVTNAGFVVGAKQVQASGFVGVNPNANAEGVQGRTYVLGCFMSESNGSSIFSEAGIQSPGPNVKASAANAIKCASVGDLDEFQLTVPAGIGGAGVTLTLRFVDTMSDPGASPTNLIHIKKESSDADSASNLILAINGSGGDETKVRYRSDTAGTAANGVAGVSAAIGSPSTSVTITAAEPGTAGNAINVTDVNMGTPLGSVSFTGGDRTASVPILRGIVMAASGVALTLSGNKCPASGKFSSVPPTAATIGNPNSNTIRGGTTGSMKMINQEFIMYLNGHKGLSSTKRVLTASMDTRAQNYFANVFNTDPLKIEEEGHVLYTHYDIHPALAVATGSGVIPPSENADAEDVVFVTSGSAGYNAGTATKPNYENFQDRFATAFSPFVFTQNFGGVPYELFRVLTLSDGAGPTTEYKISIENIKKSSSTVDKFGSFDVIVREFGDSDEQPVVLEAFRGCSLDPNSERFVARVIGDQRIFFDFDQNTGSQKLVVEGDHPNRSTRIRIEMSEALASSEVPDTALPMGFRGPYHLVTSGSGQLVGIRHQLGSTGQGRMASDAWVTGSDWIQNTNEPPVPFRENITLGTGVTKRAKSMFYWGIQFDRKESPTEPNKIALPEPTIKSYAKYFPRFEGSSQDVSVGNNAGVADVGGTILDCDRFNNNKFTLENVRVRTGSDGLADVLEWSSASYVRKGNITPDDSSTGKTRAFKVDDLKHSANRNYAKFSFFLQGGFDGVNIFDKDKTKLNNTAAAREMDDETNQGGVKGSTVGSFRKAIDIMGNTTDVSMKLLAIPGMRETGITDFAITAVENRFDTMYIMDIEERDTLNTVVTGSAQNVSVSNTVSDFLNRALDTSFAAAYFPDVIVQDPMTLTNVQVPPSVVTLGAFALNDSVGHPWFAPAGFARGALRNAQRAAVEVNRQNLDDLYDADINPLTDFPGTGLVVFGQKTLLAASSALDRVNVRRLLLEIRRSVRSVANLILFEPNRQSTLEKFSALVNPILQAIQEQSGVDRYKVVIDTTTTTQADIENNTIRGKIFLQPTRSVEFIALDFEVTNAGGSI